MRVRSLTAAAAMLALTLVMTGCTKSAPKITDEQLADWRALAADTIPSATAIEIVTDQEATMASLVNLVFVTVHFENFADLKAGDEAAAALESTIEKESGRAGVTTTLVNDGSGDFEADVSVALLAGVQGLDAAKADSQSEYVQGPTAPDLSLTVYLYVADPAVIDAQWLDDVSRVAEQVASNAGGHLHGIAVLPADTADLNIDDLDFDTQSIPLSGLEAIKDAGVAGGCLRTTDWAYDVTNPWAFVYPADAGEGACA